MRVSKTKFGVLLLAAVCAFGVSAPVAQATPSCSIHQVDVPFASSGNLDGFWDFKCGAADWNIYAYPIFESGGSFHETTCNSVSGNCIHQWGIFNGGTEHSHLDGWDTDLQVCSNRWRTHIQVYNGFVLFAEYSSNTLAKTC
jgi:hypothetical protein